MADFLMPALGADMETGKVVQWNVHEGDRVKPGDVVCVVETHKGAIDVECFLDGVIEALAPVGESMPVGAVLAHVRGAGEVEAKKVAPTPSPAAAAPEAAALVAKAPAPAAASRPLAPSAAGERVKASPAARRRAETLGLSLAGITGHGVDGGITLADVEAAAGAPAAAAAPATPKPARGFDAAQMRLAIAAAMSRSKREIPHYYLTSTIDFEAASRWLEDYNRERDPAERLLPAVLLLKATALALARVPQLNGFYENGAFRPGAGLHVGWAVSLRGGGLVAPAIHDVDKRTLSELMTALRDLVQRARAGGLRSSEMVDPTVTVTSLGERGAESVLGVIYPPQVALVGFGRVVERPWVVGGQVVVRRLVLASLAADHRASDGHVGGQLLAAIDAALQDPATL
jgi:pyruvate dehydrogenase E2 component (dihydrolipoamide acetyltransferase)